jgi:hypothetical protein
MRRTRPAPPAVVLITLLVLFAPFSSHASAPVIERLRSASRASQGPESALERLRAGYEAKDAAAYEAAFTPGFRFHFGDAEGRSAHPEGWGREDEVASARHLFEGFVDRQGIPRPAARALALDWGHVVTGPDPEYPCDPEHHALVDAADVALTIDFAEGAVVARGHHAFWVERQDQGDWLVRRWVEEPDESLLVVRCEALAAADTDSVATSGVALATNGAVPLWTLAPNPSRRGTTATLSFEVPRDGDMVEAALYDIAGRRVGLLARGPSEAGVRTIAWDGRNDRGEATGSGIWFLRVRVGTLVRNERVVRIP